MLRIECHGLGEHSSPDASGAPRRSNAALPHGVRKYSDGLMEIIEMPTAGNIVADSVVSDAGEEKERVFGSEEIDKGEFGAVYHPVTGQKLANLKLAFDGMSQCFKFELRVARGYGWGVEVSSWERLPLIGDKKEHTKSDFPLLHWNFNPYTGEKLQK